MLDTLDRRTNLGHGLVLRAISIAFIYWFMTSWAEPFRTLSSGLDPLDMRVWYSPEEGMVLVNALGAEGAAYYLHMIAADFVFMGFAITGDLILLRVLLQYLRWQDWPRWLLVAAMVADATENTITALVLNGAPGALFWLGGAATLFKQASATILLGVYAVGLPAAAWRRLRRPAP